MERMQELEEYEAELSQRKQAWDEAEAAAKAEWDKVADELNALKADLKGLEQGRSEMLEKLPPSLVNRYRKIADKRGDGVAMIEADSICGSCRMTIRPQLVLQVYRGELIETCEGCSRILVHPKSTQSAAAEAAVSGAQA